MLFVVAPGVWYEVAVRNDFIANLLLVGAFVNWLSSRITTVWLTGHAIVLGIVAGLFARRDWSHLSPWNTYYILLNLCLGTN